MPIVILPPDEPLLRAAKDRHTATVERDLDKGKHVDSRDLQFGRTLLIWAAMHGHKGLVALLLKRNASIDAKDFRNCTALSQAAANGQIDVSNSLLAASAQTETRNISGHTSLTLAAKSGSGSVVKYLLAAGAHVDAQDWCHSRTALSWAAEIGNEAIVETLLKSGWTVDLTDDKNRTPMSWAVMNGHANVVKLCLQWNASTESKDADYGRTPLLWAIKQNHDAIIEILKKCSPLEINYGLPLQREPPFSPRLDDLQELFKTVNPDFDWRRNQGGELLIWTLESDREEDFKFVIEQGACPNARDSDGDSILAKAAFKGTLAMVEMLLEYDIEVDPENGSNPLSAAAEAGHVEIARLLVEKNVNLEVTDESGMTPLLYAACGGHEEHCVFAIESGCRSFCRK